MTNILIVYSTTDGHTVEICERLRQVAGRQGQRAELVSIEDVEGVDLGAFDKIVVGASIRYGRHNPRVRDFVNKHAALLDSKPNAFSR